MKQCTKCKELKDISYFTFSKKNKDGLHCWCKDCVNLYRRENNEKYKQTQQKYAKDNKEKIYEYAKQRRATKEYKEMKSLSDAKYRIKNSESIKELKSQYYSTRQHLRVAEYQRNKQGYIARAYQRRKNIQNLTPADADKKAIQFFYNRAKHLTEITGIKHEVDHIVPISKGGLHHQDNLQVLIWIDNRKKGNKMTGGRTFEKFKGGGK